MAGQCEMSREKLERRRRELRERKHSFIELVMQVKKKIHKAELARRREGVRSLPRDAAGED